jgi:hypothetical protein
MEYDRIRSHCNNDWSITNADEIKRGVEWLKSIPGPAVCKEASCFMVMCEGKSAMWWCSDVSSSLAHPFAKTGAEG